MSKDTNKEVKVDLNSIRNENEGSEEKSIKVTKKEKKSEKKLEELQKKYDELENKYYHALADMDNTRKQNEKDRQQFIKYRSMGFIENLLPILDGFSRALSIPQEDPKIKNYLQGFNYIYRQMLEVLENEGVKKVTPKIGHVFDAKTMHAIDVEYREDMKENHVTSVYADGYLLHDRIVRPAMVVVSTKDKEKTLTDEEKENIQKEKENSDEKSLR